MTEYKMQLLCLCLLLFIGSYHLRCKRLQTTAVKLFDRIIAVAIINIIFDIITVYTVNHINRVPAGLNRLVHQIFVGSLNLYIFLVCTYIIQVVRSYKKSTRKLKLILSIPLILSWIIVAFGPISYHTSGRIAYSYGWVTTTCYLMVIIYIGIALYYSFRYWNQLDSQKKNAMLPALLIMAVITIIQKFYPESLVSAIGVTLMVFSIFISLENPSDYIDKKSGVYNVEGFSIVLAELCAELSTFTIVSVYIKNINEIRNDYGLNIEYKALNQLKDAVYRKYHQDLFLTYDGCVSIIVRKDASDEINEIHEYLSKGMKVWDNIIAMEYELQTITNKDCKTAEQALTLVIDTANKIAYSQVYLDRSTGVSNRNAYEKDIDLIFNRRNQFQTIWYVIIDLNNLKYINDTCGHTEGDKLLRDCAKILMKHSGTNHRVYRIGGDEFCMIILDQTESEVQDILASMEKERQTINQDRDIPISFALGYSGYRHDLDQDLSEVKIRADKMMYEIKHIMKHNNR